MVAAGGDGVLEGEGNDGVRLRLGKIGEGYGGIMRG